MRKGRSPARWPTRQDCRQGEFIRGLAHSDRRPGADVVDVSGAPCRTRYLRCPFPGASSSLRKSWAVIQCPHCRHAAITQDLKPTHPFRSLPSYKLRFRNRGKLARRFFLKRNPANAGKTSTIRTKEKRLTLTDDAYRQIHIAGGITGNCVSLQR
jgi:hypothetical protein